MWFYGAFAVLMEVRWCPTLQFWPCVATVVPWVAPPHMRELQSQANPSRKGGKKKAKRVVEGDSSSDGSWNGKPVSLAEEVKSELARGKGLLDSMRLYLRSMQ